MIIQICLYSLQASPSPPCRLHQLLSPLLEEGPSTPPPLLQPDLELHHRLRKNLRQTELTARPHPAWMTEHHPQAHAPPTPYAQEALPLGAQPKAPPPGKWPHPARTCDSSTCSGRPLKSQCWLNGDIVSFDAVTEATNWNQNQFLPSPSQKKKNWFIVSEFARERAEP